MKTNNVLIKVDMTEASYESQPVRTNELFGYSIQAAWGASAGRTGTLKLQASNNAYYKPYKTEPDNRFQDLQEETRNEAVNANAIWNDIPGSAKTVDATADQHFWDVSDVMYSAVRIVWEGTAGAEDPDDAECYVHGKGTID
jgi:hypothetical protein